MTILAVAGIAAAVWHLVRAAFRFLRQGAAGIWANELARTRARRGDVTALDEARREGEQAGRMRVRAGLEALAWLALLVVPVLSPWPRLFYACYSSFWLSPLVRRLRA
jgi:hypothetical protein